MPGSDVDHPEFKTDVEALIRDNTHFIEDPEDISKFRKPGFVGAIKFALIYGSGRRLLKHRRKWYSQWAKGERFLIGDDMSEERYFIVLSDAAPTVHCYSLENGRNKRVAASIEEWLAKVKLLMAETADET
jgi:hypothetical protein